MHRILLLVVGSLLSGLLAGQASAQLHKDSRLGFQFKAPKDFKAVAIQPGESIAVARYQDESRKTAGDYAMHSTYEVRFYRAPKAQANVEASAGGEPPPGALDAAMRYLEAAFGYYEIERDKTLKVAGRDARELQIKPGKDQPVRAHVVLVEQDDGVFLLEGMALADAFDKAKNEFAKAARSFKRIEKEDAEERQAADAQLSEQERFLKTQIDKLPPGWSSLRTEHYLFLYNAEKGFVKQMADQIEGMRAAYEELYPPDRPIEAISIVRVCNSVEEFQAYSGAGPGVGGYWASGQRELVFYDKHPRDETLCVLNHEALHQYIYYFYGELAPHSWYNEGHGDYFSGAELTKSYRITGYGAAPGGFNRRDFIKERVRLARQGKSLAEGAAPPLKELLNYSQPEYYSNARPVGFYPEGWAVVHMLRQSKRLSPKVAKILPDYLENLLAARHEKAVEALAKARADAEAVEEGSSADLADDEPSDWYGRVDDRAVQVLAYEKTFADWTDADWQAFDEAWWDYVEKQL